MNTVIQRFQRKDFKSRHNWRKAFSKVNYHFLRMFTQKILFFWPWDWKMIKYFFNFWTIFSSLTNTFETVEERSHQWVISWNIKPQLLTSDSDNKRTKKMKSIIQDAKNEIDWFLTHNLLIIYSNIKNPIFQNNFFIVARVCSVIYLSSWSESEST